MSRRNTRSRNKSKKINKKIISEIIAFAIILIFALVGSNIKISNIESDENPEKAENIDTQITDTEKTEETTETSNLEVYFIDVGQADSILVLNNDQSMLIDAGNNEDGESVVNFIKDKGIETLNYVVRNTSTRRSYRWTR